MGFKRYANKRDANEGEVIDALEDAGCRVMKLNEFDLLVEYRGQVFMVEVKNPKGKNTLTELQEELLEAGWPLKVVRSKEEAFEAVGLKETV